MKIGLICNEYPPAPHGGIGTFVHTLAHGLAMEGHAVMVVGLMDQACTWWDGPVEIVNLEACRLRGLAWAVNRWRLHRYLGKRWSAGELDVVECPEYQGWLPMGLRGCPVVLRLHQAQTTIGRMAGRPVPTTIQLSERLTLKSNRRWIGVSRFVLELTQGTFSLEPALSRVIYNPISPPTSIPAMPKGVPMGPYLLFAGTLSARKGAFVVAEAAKRLLTDHPEWNLVYVGFDPGMDGRSSLDQIRGILGPDLVERMHYLGVLPRDQVLQVMGGAVGFLFPSNLESFGLTVGEAMLVGCPVVVSNQPPFTEFIEDGVTGLLVDPGDPEALAGAVSMLLADPRRTEEMTRRAHAIVVERFSLETCLTETLAFYAEAMNLEKDVRS